MRDTNLRLLGGAIRAGIDTVAGTINALVGGPASTIRTAPVHAVTVRSMIFERGEGRPAVRPLDRVADTWRERRDSWLWIHSDGGTEGMRALCAGFDVEPAVFRSAEDSDSPPAAERAGSTVRVLLREMSADGIDGDFSTEPLHAFVADRVVVTCRSGRSRAADVLTRELLAGAIRADGPTDLVVRLARRIAEQLVDSVGTVETVLDKLEDRVFAEPDTARSRNRRSMRNAISHQLLAGI